VSFLQKSLYCGWFIAAAITLVVTAVAGNWTVALWVGVAAMWSVNAFLGDVHLARYRRRDRWSWGERTR
jgi:hypothetical protein